MPNFTYPTVLELKEINNDLQAIQSADSPIFEHFPIVDVESDIMRWEQRDDYTGMQQVRGLNGQPGIVNAIGSKAYMYEPGVYGEVAPIDEREITRRAQLAQVSARPISIDDLVMERNKYLLHRELVLMEYMLWQIAQGSFSIAKDGTVVHTDRYPVQTAARAVDWDTVATSTPLVDFRTVQALDAGHGVSFGTGATAFMNRVTYNKMMACTNVADLAGRLFAMITMVPIGGGGTALADLALVNRIMAGADLPQIAVYNKGYKAETTGTFTQFIADDVVIIFGQRPTGEPLGEYRRTINANNSPVGAGSYVKVVDSAISGNPNPVPRKVDVHRGHNGGPVIYYPSGVVVLSV